jgi:FkbM family methyltransferase
MNGLGWVPAMFSSGLMTAEQQFWSSLNLSGMTVYDIGALHGLLTLFFASRAKAGVCFEPQCPKPQAPGAESEVERDQECYGAQAWRWLPASKRLGW